MKTTKSWCGLKNLDLAQKVTTKKNYIWRDLKTWGNYLYCINDEDGDGGAGLQILNLEELISGVSNPTYIENIRDGLYNANKLNN